MTDPRSLIQRLADALTAHGPLPGAVPLLNEARAYLAQPEPEELSDAELLELMPETIRDEFSYAAKVCSDAMGGRVKQ